MSVDRLRQMLSEATPARACARCGASLEGRYRNTIYCTRSCKEKDRWKKSAVYREGSKKRSKAYRSTEKGKELVRQIGRRMYVKHHDKALARAAVLEEVRRGRIFKPDACWRCETVGPVEAHHHRGYEGDARLDVVWLCKPCHVEADRSQT